MQKRLSSNNTNGFTIVELLVVIIIIGILASITIISYNGIQNRAIEATIKSDLTNASNKIKMYEIEHGYYPGSVTDCPVPAAGNICLKSSGGNSFSGYSANNSTIPKTFQLTATHDTIGYVITNDTAPVAVVISTSATTFAKAWGSTGSDSAFSVIQTSDDGYAVTGITDSYGAGGYDSFFAKYSSTGSLSWLKTWGGVEFDHGTNVAQTADGGYILTGDTKSFGDGLDSDIFLARYDASGNLLWSKTWGGDGDDVGPEVTITSDGGYAVVGFTTSFGANSTDAFIAKFNDSGDLAWAKTWGSTDIDYGENIIQTSDNGFVMLAETIGYGAGDYDAVIAKYDASGNLSWSKTLGGTGNENWYEVVQAADGGYVMVGDSNGYGAGGTDSYITKLDESGNLLWAKSWGSPNDDWGGSLAKATDGGYIVSGATNGYGAGDYDTFIAKYDASGNLSWSKTWGGTDYEEGVSIFKTSDDGYAVAGYTYSFGSGQDDIFLVKYNSSGGIVNCSSPMCQTVNATVNTFAPTVTSQTPIVTSQNTASISRTPTVTDQTPTTTTMVAP